MNQNETTLLANVLGARDDATGAQEKAQVLVSETVNSLLPNNNPLMREGAMNLLAAVVLRVHLDESMPDTLEEVNRVLTNPCGRDYLDRLFEEYVLPDNQRCCLKYWGTISCIRGKLFDEILLNTTIMMSPFHFQQIKALFNPNMESDNGI